MSQGVAQFIPLLLIGLIILFFVARSKAKKLDPRNELEKAKRISRIFASEMHKSDKVDTNSFSYNFGKSIRVCFQKYFVFDGKASRSEFWYFILFINILYIPAFIIDLVFFINLDIDTHGVIPGIVLLIAAIPSWAVGARRLHDTGRTGWLQLLSLTIIGIIPLIIWFAEKGKSISVSETKNNNKNELGDKLRELNQLYKERVLTKAEFTKAKNKLLK